MATLAASLGVGIPIRAWLSLGRAGSGAPVEDRRNGGGGASDPGSTMSLSDLAAAAAAGDERAFEALHRRVGTGLRRVLLGKCGGRTDVVDDLMQTTWAAVWQALKEGRYDPARAAITTFVYAVGHNAWLTHLRRLGRPGGAVLDGEQGAGSTGTGAAIDEAMAEAEVLEAVRACVRDEGRAGLSEQERVILRGTAAGESDRALARRLGLSCSTVNVKKQRALGKVRAHLAERGLGEAETVKQAVAGKIESNGASRAARKDELGSSSAGLAGGVS